MYRMNQELRSLMQLSGVRQKDVAQSLKIQESKLCRMLKKELTPENRRLIVTAIQEIAITKQ